MKSLKLTLILCCLSKVLSAQIDLVDNSNIAIDLYNKALDQVNRQAYVEAIDNLERAIEADSTIRDPYLLLCKICLFEEKTQLAAQYLQKAQLIFSDDDEILYYYGKCLQKNKEYKNAIAQLDEAIRLGNINGMDFPAFYDYYASRGTCYLSLSQFENALNDFDTALSFNKTKGSIYTNRGIALYQLKRSKEACKSWEKAIELGEGYAQMYLEKYCKKQEVSN
ncbi:MAG: tetratricopeptide repeat protein [Carboxylicivirga sp.]|jgi:Tfp pilus assembly protein PilF|nr:tetratricopeptide repeat protein [Carboxylicivirga sp.]